MSIVLQLQTLLNTDIFKNEKQGARLCHPAVQNLLCQRSDFGWGCGYRNFQSILALLLELPEFSN